MTNDFTLIFSLISLGFFGGFSHCIGMCGPFVLTQVTNRLQKTSLEKFSNFEKLKNFALFPYHLGRVTTYSVLGFFCSALTKNIQDFTNFRIFSAVFLILAALLFLNLLLEKKINFRLPFKSKTLKNTALFLRFFKGFFAKKISSKIFILFQDPQGLKGYLLGIILGFIPCGLLYAAFLIAAAISQPILAAIGMFLFGISTSPSLFLTASSGYVFLKIPEFKLVAKVVILINAIMLLLMAIKLIIF